MELVASDPDINNPAVIEWDGNGRMYVSEFRSYMRDADATAEHEPTSRISRWESTKGDGVYDRHTVFVDHVLFPRMILPIDKNCILTNETHSDDVVQYCDTNDDGMADKRRCVLYRRRRRPRRERRARAERLHLGPRQLDLQHLQLVPLPLDARWHPA